MRSAQLHVRKPGTLIAPKPNAAAKSSTTDTLSGDLWFDVDAEDLKRSEREKVVDLKPKDLFPQSFRSTSKPSPSAATATTAKAAKESPTTDSDARDKKTKYVAMDCEMVGIGPGGIDSALARVSLVDWNGDVLLDSFVRPEVEVTDYRTHVSGVHPEDLLEAPRLRDIQPQVMRLLDGRVLVGHGLDNDLRVLMLSHSRTARRDTAKYRPFRKLAKGRAPALRMLAQQVLGLTIQKASHDSLDDARAAMLLYRHVKKDWENCLFRRESSSLPRHNPIKPRGKKAHGTGWRHRPRRT